jgi:3-polyprenyl-4-hydroxybenzoate decarboxylase
VVRATTVQPGESIRYQTQTDNDNFNVLTATHHLIQRKTDIRVTSMDTGIADLLQRFQQNDIVALSEVSEEKSRQIETVEFSTSGRYQITSKWSLNATIVREVGYIIGHSTRGLIGGDGARPKTEQVNLLKLQNPKKKPINIRRG